MCLSLILQRSSRQAQSRAPARRPAAASRAPGPAGRLLAVLVLLVSNGAGGLPLISEVLYDAPGSDDGLGFIELIAPAGLDLAGHELQGINGSGGGVTTTLALSGLVGSDGIYLIADVRADGSTSVPGADLGLDFDLQNGPDSLVLIGPGGGLLDALGYGDFGAGDVFAGEGSAAPDAPAGSSLARRAGGQDSGDNALDFEVLAVPTPGSVPLPVDEPALASGALALLLGGLRLATRSRRRIA